MATAIILWWAIVSGDITAFLDSSVQSELLQNIPPLQSFSDVHAGHEKHPIFSIHYF
jgi:hypothetical protein